MTSHVHKTVVLQGGPFDGESVEVNWGQTLAINGPNVPDGMVARYRPTRTRGFYRFREFDRVVASIPWPPEAS